MRILVAGIGNIFLGDDGFGVEVARRLRERPIDGPVEVSDFGIRGIHLAYELSGGGYDLAILVDAVSRGDEPGTVTVIEPEVDEAGATSGAPDAHSLTPDAVLAWVRRAGAAVPRIVIVGCEPAAIEEGVGLSAVVDAAVEPAIDAVRGLVSAACGVSPCA